ncbi:MAG: hypothetical protein IPN46_18785 [Saprospiraceae bacterium]|nr:hypothetical protein [Saprospiraceae bacterium]
MFARVGEQYFFKSQLEELVHDGTSPTDSAAIVDGLLQNWIRKSDDSGEADKMWQQISTSINCGRI